MEVFQRKRDKKDPQPRGLLLYASIQDVIFTHSTMQKEGMEVMLVPPPRQISVGCDLAIQFRPEEEEILRGLLGRGAILPGTMHYIDYCIPQLDHVVSLKEIAPGFLMATSYNIKVTLDLGSHEIVNISGGGCPDIPYVARSLLFQRIESCPEPVDAGTSLCTYMVQLAVDRLRAEVKRCSP